MKQILVGMDGSAGARASLRWAAGVAEAQGAALRVVTAWHYPAATAMPWAQSELPLMEDMDRSFHETAMKILNEELEADAGDVDIDVQHGPTGAVLRAVAIDRSADMLVVGSRGLGGFSGLLLGSVSRQLVDHPPCPVVVVPSPARPAQLATILVGVDGSPGARKALEWAAELAAPTGAEVIAAHAAASPTIVPASPPMAAFRDEARAALEGPWTDVLRSSGVRHRTVFGDGDPRSWFPALAGKIDADLVIVGSRGVGPIRRMLIGSVANHLALHMDRPVAVVPQPPE